MENIYCMYRHIRLDKNEVFYIGIGTLKRPTRISGRNNLWNKITNKTDWECEILLCNLTRKQAEEKEKEFIKLYGRINLKTGTLSNLTDGGEGMSNYLMTEETRKKISEKAKGRKLSDETKKKISLSQKNERAYWFGKSLSDETKKKISLKKTNSIPYNKGVSKWDSYELDIIKMISEGLSESQISKKIGCSKGSIYRIKLKQIRNEK